MTDPLFGAASGMQVPPGTHVALIFGDDRTRLDVVADFVAASVSRGGNPSYVAVTTREEALRAALRGAGLANRPLVAGCLDVSDAAEVYRPQGTTFSGPAMLDRLRRAYGGHAAWFEGAIHYAEEMDWALTPPRPEEAPFSALCQYDARRFDSDDLFEIVSVHPYFIVDGQIVANPGFRGRQAPAGAVESCRCSGAAPGEGGQA